MQWAIKDLEFKLRDAGSSETDTHSQHILSGERSFSEWRLLGTNRPRRSHDGFHYRHQRDRSYTERNVEADVSDGPTGGRDSKPGGFRVT
jgi:hypothetical protein